MVTDMDISSGVKKMSKNAFIQKNPFGIISKQNEDGTLTALNREEYDEWVEFSRGIWEHSEDSTEVHILP